MAGITENETTMNFFDCAIKREEESAKYYEKLATLSVVPELKVHFNILAKSEQEHHDALLKMKGSITDSKSQFNTLPDAE